jgi:hypothetical protein
MAEPVTDPVFSFSPDHVFARRKLYWANGYRPLEVWGPNERVDDRGQPLKNPGKQPRGVNWQQRASRNPPEAAVTAPNPRALSTGVLCGLVVAPDIDVPQQELADRIVDLFEKRCGLTSLVRVGKAPKILLCYKVGHPFSKIQTRELYLPDGMMVKVEVLAQGQQFVADGIHPQTGQPYCWTNGSPETVPVSELPFVTEDQVSAAVVEAERILREAGAKPKQTRKGEHGPPRGASDDFFEQVKRAALANIAAWVLDLFPRAKFQPGTGAWRVSSRDLGRNREEDLSIHPHGIQDFGDEEALSSIDLVMQCGPAETPLKAALWLCEKLSIDPQTFGYIGRTRDPPAPDGAIPDISVLRLNRRPPPPFPLDVLGKKWADWTRDAAVAASCPVDYVAAPLLSLASALIGNARWSRGGPGWEEPPHLWIGSVGDSGDGKSPGADTLFRYVVPRLEENMRIDFPDQLREWRAKAEMAKAQLEAWQHEVRDAQKRKLPPPLGPEGMEAVPAQEPQRPRLIQVDVTHEKVASLLATASPKGVLMFRDELAGFLIGMNSYSDAARPFWIEAYGGRRYLVERVKLDLPIDVQHLAVAWFGTIQPERLAHVMRDADDGLLARFSWFWPEPVPFDIGKQPPNTVFATAALDRLRLLEMRRSNDGKLEPVGVPLCPVAQSRLVEFGRLMQRRKELTEGLLRSTYGKARGLALRLALVFEFLWWCARDGIEAPPSSISDLAMDAAARWVCDYSIPMNDRTYGDAACSKADRDTATLARWIAQERSSEVHVRTLQREVRLPGLRDAADIHAACAALIDAGWLMSTAGKTGFQHRPRAAYAINPRLWDHLR